jgi:hypothetical protein
VTPILIIIDGVASVVLDGEVLATFSNPARVADHLFMAPEGSVRWRWNGEAFEVVPE